MDTIKVVYICHFSNQDIRNQLKLNSLCVGNWMRKIMRMPLLYYRDFATWDADFIAAISRCSDFKCYVISHHLGMKRSKQRFSSDGVNYVFLQQKQRLFRKVIKKIACSNLEEDYTSNAQNIKRVVDEINPDIVVVCGAENPIYSSSVLLINDKPIFVILQTLLNDLRRIKLGMSSTLRCQLECAVFEHAGYFGTFNRNEVHFILQHNPNAKCLQIVFPSSVPADLPNVDKDFDFVFFANGLSKQKGTEDALRAFAYVKRIHSDAKFYMIGACSSEYLLYINGLINELGLKNNVTYHGSFPSKNDIMAQVKRAKVAVLPGITAPLNSTVREVMLLGLPTIVYDNPQILFINKDNLNLLSARMENVEDLGIKMLYAYEHPNEMEAMATSAQNYAQNVFAHKAVGRILEAEIKAIYENYYKKLTIPEGLLIK